MGMIFKISAGSGFLHVSATGEFTLGEAKRTFLEVLDALARHNYEKVVIDGRKLTGEPKTIERFYYGEFAAQAVASFRGVSRASKFAYVLEPPVLDPGRFGETVAVNRGMNVKAFENLEDAFGWLGLAPAKKPDEVDA